MGKENEIELQEQSTFDKNDRLNQLVQTGLTKRYGNITDDILSRAEYEMQIISKTNFTSQVLFVFECVEWLKSQNIRVGSVEGTAPSSLLFYTLGLTNVDPIKHNLFFERFINPLYKYKNGISDICIQIDYRYVEKIINHLKDIYDSVVAKEELLGGNFPRNIFHVEIKNNNEELFFISFIDMHQAKSEDIAIMYFLLHLGCEYKLMTYLENKHSPEKIKYIHECFGDILDKTYGVLLFQEQFLQIVNNITGFTFAQADLMRRSLGKKKADEIQKWNADFVSAAITKGFDKKTSDEIFQFLCREIDYCICKANVLACVSN